MASAGQSAHVCSDPRLPWSLMTHGEHRQKHLGFLVFNFELILDCCLLRSLFLLPDFSWSRVHLHDPVRDRDPQLKGVLRASMSVSVAFSLGFYLALFNISVWGVGDLCGFPAPTWKLGWWDTSVNPVLRMQRQLDQVGGSNRNDVLQTQWENASQNVR